MQRQYGLCCSVGHSDARNSENELNCGLYEYARNLLHSMAETVDIKRKVGEQI